jgi:hypothetical protein
VTRLPIAAGAAGSALVAVGGFGVGGVPRSLSAGWLHDTTAGRGLSYALCAAGVLVLLGAWWALRGATATEVKTAAALWSVPLLVCPPLFSRDVYAYAAQAHVVATGLDPYTHGPSDAPGPLTAEVDDVWAAAPSPYGPLFLRLAGWLVPGQHVVAAVLVLRLLAVLGLVLLAWALPRLADAHGVPAASALWLGVANPLVLLHGIAGAHNDLLMVGLLAAGLAVAVGGSDRQLVLGTALIGLAVLVKAPALLALPFLPFLRPVGRLRAAVVVALTAAVTIGAVTAATGLGWGWLDTLSAGNPRRSLLSATTGIGVLLSNVTGDGAVAVAHKAGTLLAVTMAVLLWVGVRQVGAVKALGLSLVAVVVLGPVVQPWYLLWALVPLAAVAGERLAVGLAVSSAVLCLLILPGGRHLIRPPLYGLPAVLVIAAGYAASRSDFVCSGHPRRHTKSPVRESAPT